MVEPSMAVMDGLERAIIEPHVSSAEVTKFAPQKYRGGNASLSANLTDMRNKTVLALEDDIRRQEDQLAQLKAVLADLKRIIG
jgi:hypothetical protein